MSWIRKHRKNGGFTLIEAAVGFLIIAAAAASMFYGISYAKAQIRDVAIREKAMEELVGYLEFWRAKIAHKAFQTSDLVQPSSPERVVLFSPFDDPKDTWTMGQEVIEGRIYRDRIEPQPSPENPAIDYYPIHARIEWDDPLGDKRYPPEPIRLEVSAFVFK